MVPGAENQELTAGECRAISDSIAILPLGESSGWLQGQDSNLQLTG